MFKLKLIALSCILLALLLKANSQDVKPITNEIGIHAGTTTGIGLSYRHWFNKNGFQITAVPIKNDYRQYYNAGLTYLHTFYQSTHVCFYGYTSVNYVYHHRAHETWANDDLLNEKINLGVGPAFSFGRVVKFNLMVGYGMYDVVNKFETNFAGEVGLYYTF